MNFTIGWPQFIWLALALVTLVFKIVQHGKPRDNHDAIAHSVALILSALLMWWGGFFG